MTQITKYAFRTDFTAARKAAPVRPEPEPEAEPEGFTEADLQAARDSGYESGITAGRAQAMADIAKRTESVLEAIGRDLAAMSAAVEDQRAAAHADVVVLARAIAAKVLGSEIDAGGVDRIETMARLCLESLFGQPQATVRVDPDLADAVAGRLAPAVGTITVTVTPDPALAPGDCALAWQNGGADRITDEVWQRIDEVLGRALDQAQGDESPMGGEAPSLAAPEAGAVAATDVTADVTETDQSGGDALAPPLQNEDPSGPGDENG